MTTHTTLLLEERVFQILEHLGIKKAHFAAKLPGDWQGFVTAHPECVDSLTLLCPRRADPGLLKTISPKLLVITGDLGREVSILRSNLADLSEATVVTLSGYSAGVATDVAAERPDAITDAMSGFLENRIRDQETKAVSLPQGAGEAAGILFHVQGSGPPLVLFPLEYSPSQWGPILPKLSQSHTTIALSGANVGSVAGLEARAKGGYLTAVERVVDEACLQPGEKVLDVGCGPGSLDRWLARRTEGANSIVGVDPSIYLIGEAKALARSEGLEHLIEFQEAGGESLPFPNNGFDVTLSFTVMQFVDADRMLSEMMRVTKPGGRIGLLTRGDDRPLLINLDVRGDLKTKAEAQRTELANPLGCGDASLYHRLHQAGLSQVRMFPQFAVYTDSARLQEMQDQIFSAFTLEEAAEWRAALAAAESERSFFIAEPFHCAVGTKL